MHDFHVTAASMLVLWDFESLYQGRDVMTACANGDPMCSCHFQVRILPRGLWKLGNPAGI